MWRGDKRTPLESPLVRGEIRQVPLIGVHPEGDLGIRPPDKGETGGSNKDHEKQNTR